MVSWAGRLTPDASSRRQCQFGVLAVGGGLCECRYGGARWLIRGPAGQWRLHFEARGVGPALHFSPTRMIFFSIISCIFLLQVHQIPRNFFDEPKLVYFYRYVLVG